LKSESGIKEKPQLRELGTGPLPEDIVQVTSQDFKCDRKRIIQKGGKRNIARDVAIYLSRKMTADSGVELGRYFGGISGAGIAVRYKYISEKIYED
jgi:chromosomal replication initiation ATPase DnaA